MAPTKGRPNTRAEARVARSNIKKKEAQLHAAVQWCRENNARGHAALKTGLFNLIKSRSTIDNRLDGKIVTGCEKQYSCILTHLEEESVVRFVKNKNRCLQGINKKQLTNLILDILKIRDYANKKLKGGRRYTNLSVNAKMALQNKKLSRSFWKRWDAKHDDLRMKRQGTVTMNRAMNCTRDMTSSHLDALVKELIDAGIFTNTKQVAPGVWTGQINTSRVFNHDETPQFINYGVDGTPNGLVYAGRGESCKQMINENRDHRSHGSKNRR